VPFLSWGNTVCSLVTTKPVLCAYTAQMHISVYLGTLVPSKCLLENSGNNLIWELAMLLLPAQTFTWQMDSDVAGNGAVAGGRMVDASFDPAEFDVPRDDLSIDFLQRHKRDVKTCL